MRTHDGKTIYSGTIIEIDGKRGLVKCHNDSVAHILVDNSEWWLIYPDPEKDNELLIWKGYGEAAPVSRAITVR